VDRWAGVRADVTIRIPRRQMTRVVAAAAAALE